jgi:hypothetical protein
MSTTAPAAGQINAGSHAPMSMGLPAAPPTRSAALLMTSRAVPREESSGSRGVLPVISPFVRRSGGAETGARESTRPGRRLQ